MSPKAVRPLDPESLKYFLEKKAQKYPGVVVTKKQRGLLAGMLEEALSGDTKGRYAVTEWLTGSASTGDLEDEMVCALLDWLGPERSAGRYEPSPFAIKEARRVLTVALKDQGQLELL